MSHVEEKLFQLNSKYPKVSVKFAVWCARRFVEKYQSNPRALTGHNISEDVIEIIKKEFLASLEATEKYLANPDDSNNYKLLRKLKHSISISTSGGCPVPLFAASLVTIVFQDSQSSCWTALRCAEKSGDPDKLLEEFMRENSYL